MSTAMDDLIARLEKATGPDRELDMRISGIFPHDDNRWRYPANYTGSIDAALTLVPPEWAWSLHGGEGVCAGVQLVRNGGETPDDEIDVPDGITTELCLCIAALKARAAHAKP